MTPQSVVMGKVVDEAGDPLQSVQITVMTAFPHTPLYERLRREGRLLQENAWELCTLFDINYQPSRMSVDELECGLRGLAKKMYSEEAIHTRRRRFLERKRELEAVA